MRPGELVLQDARRDGSHTVALAGELDIATAPDLEAMVLGLCVDGAREIELDLSEVSFVDSAGLRAILSARTLCEEHRCQLLLTRPREPVQRLFELTGLLEKLPFRATPRPACEHDAS
jgi:anti-anti-sigma factor